MTQQEAIQMLKQNYPSLDHPAARIQYWDTCKALAEQLCKTNRDFAKFLSACDPDAAN